AASRSAQPRALDRVPTPERSEPLGKNAKPVVPRRDPTVEANQAPPGRMQAADAEPNSEANADEHRGARHPVAEDAVVRVHGRGQTCEGVHAGRSSSGRGGVGPESGATGRGLQGDDEVRWSRRQHSPAKARELTE